MSDQATWCPHCEAWRRARLLDPDQRDADACIERALDEQGVFTVPCFERSLTCCDCGSTFETAEIPTAHLEVLLQTYRDALRLQERSKTLEDKLRSINDLMGRFKDRAQ